MNWSLSGVAILGAVIWAAILVSMQPRIAHFYVEKGNQARSNGSLTQAIQHYQRAISINPDDHKAHYELASAYEDVRELDKSIIEYQTAILLNDQNSLAYNNLARLYILQKKDFTSAIELLDKAITNVKPTNLLPAYRFAFYKNRGWAYMCLERYSQARDDLKFALTIQEKSSVAHYLLGKIAEAQKQRKTAVQHWEECRKLISTDSEQLKDMEADWTAYIRERLDDGGER
jgi:tetratricopeptide (TPR) repeat protein